MLLKSNFLQLSLRPRLIPKCRSSGTYIETKGSPKQSYSIAAVPDRKTFQKSYKAGPTNSQVRYKSKMTEATANPLSGLWKPTHLKALYYGPDTVSKNLISSLPSASSKAFIVTGNSLATKTSLIKEVENLLGSKHAGTFSKIGEHAPVAQLDEATERVKENSDIDTIISIGGGSPIDSAKAISHRVNEKTGKFLYHITIPTTLSAAECTFNAGYTEKTGVKTGVAGPELAPHVIIYDAKFGLETPPNLWLSTGLRALDHAVECLYHPTATEIMHLIALQAASSLFTYLPKYKQDPKNVEYITQLQLAAFTSLGFMGLNVKGSLGLSHTLGYALGSPYGIPHGITSCMTLGHVAKLKAEDPEAAKAIARLLPFLGKAKTGNDKEDAKTVGDEILRLVQELGLKTTLTEKGVGKDQLDIIVQRATGGQKEGVVYEKVAELVKGLF